MRDIIALLRSLVLPAGAISGQRIVLDGDLGTIEFFDGNNVRRLRIGQFFDGIEFFSGQASETNPGDVYSRAIGLPVSASRQAQLVLDSPQITNARSTIDLRSASFDNTIAALINMVSVDAQFNSVSFVRRAPVAPAKITANQTLITAEADITGLTLTWTADAAHRYKLTVAGRGALLTTAAIAGRCRVSITDASNNHVGGDCDIFIPVGIANSVIGPVYDVAYLTGLSGAQTYKVRGAKIAGDAGATMTFAGAPGAGTGGATFAVEDLGIV